jgi:hypothetical protein
MLAGNTVWNPWEPQGAYDSLATVTVPAGGLANVTFAGIPNTYKHLQLRVSALTETSGKVMAARFNSDSSGSYTWHFLNGQGTATNAGNATGNTYARFFGQDVGTNTNHPSVAIIDLLDYSNLSKNKIMRALSGSDNNGNGETGLQSSLWINTSAISSVTFVLNDGSDYAQNSIFSLYGVR